jgi:hypothetical protein
LTRPTTTWAAAICLILTGCGGSLRPDPNPYALKSNVPTAEIVACGGRAVGLKTCAIERGRDLAELDIRVQGYGSGTVLATSDSCQLEYPTRYTGNAEVSVPLAGPAAESCVIAITVTPEYPGERKSSLEIGALKAFVRVRVTDHGASWFGQSDKVPEGGDLALAVPGKPGDHIMVRGCDAKLDRELSQDAALRLSDLPYPGMKGCAYEGAVDHKDGTRTLFTWLVWRHAKAYVPAPNPEAKLGTYDSTRGSGFSISLEADPSVSVLSFDASYKLKNSRAVRYDPAKPHVIRALTVGGRNVVGEFENGVIRWMR